jgi:hypothetical protein
MATFTPVCGHEGYTDYHKKHKIYFCRTCNIMGGFTPYKLEYFAPFNSMAEAQLVQSEMRSTLFHMLDAVKTSPKHQDWCNSMRAAGHMK